MKQILFTIAACSVFFAVDLSVYAQPMVVTTTPLQSNGHRFFESTNMNWSMRGPNFFATFGGPNIGAPRFGGYNPHVVATTRTLEVHPVGRSIRENFSATSSSTSVKATSG